MAQSRRTDGREMSWEGSWQQNEKKGRLCDVSRRKSWQDLRPVCTHTHSHSWEGRLRNRSCWRLALGEWCCHLLWCREDWRRIGGFFLWEGLLIITPSVLYMLSLRCPRRPGKDVEWAPLWAQLRVRGIGAGERNLAVVTSGWGDRVEKVARGRKRA